MALAPNRSRAKRTPFSTFADQLYPEDGPHEASPDDQEEGEASAETVAPRTPVQEIADSLYPGAQAADGDSASQTQGKQQYLGAMAVYVIRKGDTLWNISEQSGIPLKDIRAANMQIADPAQVPVGTKIILPLDVQADGNDETAVSTPKAKSTTSSVDAASANQNSWNVTSRDAKTSSADSGPLATEEMRNWTYWNELQDHFVTGKARDHIFKYLESIKDGLFSVADDLVVGSKDAAGYLADLSGINGTEAQEKVRDQLGAFVDDGRQGYDAINKGLQSYFNDPEARNAVNKAIRNVAPEVWKQMQEKGWEFLGDPEKTGRAVGRGFSSAGISKTEAPAKYILKALVAIGNLDTTDKNFQSKLEGLLLGADYANRNTIPEGK